MSVKITIVKDGPAIIHNQSEAPTTVNEVLVAKKIALCRCGKSADKTYCDGSHAKKEE